MPKLYCSKVTTFKSTDIGDCIFSKYVIEMNRIWSLVVISTPLQARSAGHSSARSADAAPQPH